VQYTGRDSCDDDDCEGFTDGEKEKKNSIPNKHREEIFLGLEAAFQRLSIPLILFSQKREQKLHLDKRGHEFPK